MWKIKLRREVLDDALAELRHLPYAAVREIIQSPRRKTVKGRDQKDSQLSITAGCPAEGSGVIEVTFTPKRGCFGSTMTEAFAVAPGNAAPGEDNDRRRLVALVPQRREHLLVLEPGSSVQRLELD